jgi:hypothetical protein
VVDFRLAYLFFGREQRNVFKYQYSELRPRAWRPLKREARTLDVGLRIDLRDQH